MSVCEPPDTGAATPADHESAGEDDAGGDGGAEGETEHETLGVRLKGLLELVSHGGRKGLAELLGVREERTVRDYAVHETARRRGGGSGGFRGGRGGG